MRPLIILVLAILTTTTTATKTPTVTYEGFDHSVTFKGVRVVGRHGVEYSRFTRIPYALAPMGRLRFREARDIGYEGRDNVVHATANQTSMCPQMQETIFGPQLTGEEDCLHLNVFTPSLSGSSKLAVIVFLHGGGFVSGNSDIHYYKPDLLMARDLVFVSLNYRLSVLGFLALDPESGVTGNQGLKDQRMALRWVHKYIESFGGDPQRVMLMGQSAGGVAVQAQVAKGHQGLFRAAMAMSGVLVPGQQLLTLRNGRVERSSNRLVHKLGCHKKSMSNVDEDVVNCLQALELKSLFDALETFHPLRMLEILEQSKKQEIMMFVPTLDTMAPHAFFEADPVHLVNAESFESVPQLIGATTDDGALFIKGLAVDKWRRFNEQLIDTLASMVFMLDQKELEDEERMRMEIAARFYLGLNVTMDDSKGKKLSEMLSDALFLTPAFESAKVFAENDLNHVYLYELSHKPNLNNGDVLLLPSFLNNLSALHNDDLFLIFDVETLDTRVHDVNANDEDRTVSHIFVDMVANFAKTLRPTKEESGLKWPNFEVENNVYLEIATVPKVKKAFRPLNTLLWNKMIWADVINSKSTECATSEALLRLASNTAKLIDGDDINQSMNNEHGECLHFDMPHVHGPCRPDTRPVGCPCHLWASVEHIHHHCPHLHGEEEVRRSSEYLNILGYELCLRSDEHSSHYCLPTEKPTTCAPEVWKQLVDTFDGQCCHDQFIT